MRQDRRMHDGKNIVPTDDAGHEDEVSTGPDPIGITLRSRPSGWLQDGMGRKATGGLRERRGGYEATDPFVTRYAGYLEHVTAMSLTSIKLGHSIRPGQRCASAYLTAAEEKRRPRC
jgi:hypothetical protein